MTYQHNPFLGPYIICGEGPSISETVSEPKICSCGYIFGADGDCYVAKIIDKGDEVDPYPSGDCRENIMRLMAKSYDMYLLLKELRESGCIESDEMFEKVNDIITYIEAKMQNLVNFPVVKNLNLVFRENYGR